MDATADLSQTLPAARLSKSADEGLVCGLEPEVYSL